MSRTPSPGTLRMNVVASLIAVALVLAGCTSTDGSSEEPGPSPADSALSPSMPEGDTTELLAWKLGSYLEVEGETTPVGGGSARSTASGDVVVMDAWTRFGNLSGRFVVNDQGSFAGTEASGRTAWIDLTDPAGPATQAALPTLLDPSGEPQRSATLGGER